MPGSTIAPSTSCSVDSAIKNARYLMLPFNVPQGAFTHSIRWERSRLVFQTQNQTDNPAYLRSTHSRPEPQRLEARRLTSPVRICEFTGPKENAVEVNIEKFVYLA
jgi:hypothetical protein